MLRMLALGRARARAPIYSARHFWALYNIMKDWLTCPGDQYASEQFQSTIVQAEDELAGLCYENVGRNS